MRIWIFGDSECVDQDGLHVRAWVSNAALKGPLFHDKRGCHFRVEGLPFHYLALR